MFLYSAAFHTVYEIYFDNYQYYYWLKTVLSVVYKTSKYFMHFAAFLMLLLPHKMTMKWLQFPTILGIYFFIFTNLGSKKNLLTRKRIKILIFSVDIKFKNTLI